VNQADPTRKKVAFILPLMGGEMYEVYEYIRKVLEENIPDVFVTAIPSGGMGATRPYAIVESIIKKDYDLFFTFGLSTTLIAHNALQKSGKKIPFLFTGISSPEEYGIIESLERPGGNATGVIHTRQDIASYCDFFVDCFPNIKNVLLLRQNDGLQTVRKLLLEDVKDEVQTVFNYANQVIEFLQKKSIHVKVISESNEIDLFKKFKVELPNTEAVFLVEGARLASWSCDIQELCKEKSVVLYNGSIHAVRNGSSLLGYGIDYQIIAKKLSEQALAILKNNSSPQTIPVLKIENARFACLSQKVANSQNFTVPENISRKWNIKYF